MGFDYAIEIEERNFRFAIYIDPAKPRPLNSKKDVKRAVSAEFEVDISVEYLPLDIEFVPKTSASLSPASIRIDKKSDLDKIHDLVIQLSKGTPLNFYVVIFSEGQPDQSIISFEVYAPPYRVFEWGKRILPTRWQVHHSEPDLSAQERFQLTQGTSVEELPSDIEPIFNQNTPEKTLREFLDELSRWLPAWEGYYLRVLLDNKIDNTTLVSKGKKVNRYWAEQLITEDDFEFSNWNEFTQFVNTTRLLENSPDLDEGDIIAEAMAFLIEDEMGRTEPLNHLWRLEKKYDLSTNACDLLQTEHVNTLLAKSISEKDYLRFQQFLSHLTTASISSGIDKKVDIAKQSSGEEALRRWRDLLSVDMRENKEVFLNIIENYFNEYTKQNELTLVTREAIAEARGIVNDEREEPNFERTARHDYHYNRGIRYLQNDRYRDACEELLLAIGASLEEYSIHDDIRFTRLSQSLIQYYRAENQRLHQERDFSEAVHRLDNAISIVNNFEYFENKPEKREYVQNRLQVYLHETEGNRYLSNRELDLAATEFGKAVGILRQLGRDAEADYFENRRRSIEAAENEQRGNFESAANIHESIAEGVSNGESFAKFHRARSNVCKAKKQITQRDIQEARNTLGGIQIGWGITRDEIEYLNLILDELEKYEAGRLSNIGETLDTVADFSLEADDDLYVSYGHNYRPLVVNLLAAQRLTQFDIDESIPEILVDFSLDYILQPDQVEQFIERQGLSDIGLEDRWMEVVPTFALKQYQNAERTESGKIPSDNFIELGKMMTGTLEQYLEFLVEYYGYLEYGSDWPTVVNEANDDLTLRSLVDYLNKPLFDELPWADTVREVLTRHRYEDTVTPDKDGDIVDIRNDLAHNNISHLSKSDYELIKEDLETIFAETSLEMPVLGEVKGKNEFGIYKIELFQTNTNTNVQISTDIDLETESVYYFPSETTDTTPGEDIDPDNIVPCTANRVLQGVKNYSH